MKAKVLFPIILLFITTDCYSKVGVTHQSNYSASDLLCCENQPISVNLFFYVEDGGDIVSTNHRWYKNGILVSTNPSYIATDTGTYYSVFDCNYFDYNGPYISHSFKISYIQIPTITTHGNCLISSDSRQYQWYYNDAIINGATLFYFCASKYGTYKVITSTNECSKSSIEYILSSPVIPAQPDLTLFPNPSTGNFTAKLPTGTTQIKIVSTLGEMVENKIVETETSIDFTLMNDGIYFISAVTDSGIVRKKIVVSR